jgi:hypothetical protein
MSKLVYVLVFVLVLVAAFALPTHVYADGGVDTVNPLPAAPLTVLGYKGTNGYFQCPATWGANNVLVGANMSGACFYRGTMSTFGVDPKTTATPVAAPATQTPGKAISNTAIVSNPVNSAYWSFFCGIGICNTK